MNKEEKKLEFKEDLHDIWPHRWITSKASPQKSPIDGLGMFATEPIAKGEVVAVYGGIIVPKINIEEYREKLGAIRGIQIDEGFFICPTEKKGGLFNHSCEPNLGYKNTIIIVAMKDIELGDELVFDYGMSESNFKPYTCTCGSQNCRNTITPNDWEDKELQNKHGKYFATYLKNRINDSQ